MKTSYFALTGPLCLYSLSASAQIQSAPIQPAVSPIAATAARGAVLRTGTEIPLKMSEELTTKNKQVKNGQRFRMEVADNIMVNGVTVVPVGSPAVGEITDVRNKGMWGKSGHINARVLYVTVNGRQVRLAGSFDDKGRAGGVGAAAVSALVFLPAGFFMTGTSAHLPIGFPIKAFVDEDVPLTIEATTPAPLSVSIPVSTRIRTAPNAPVGQTTQPGTIPTGK